MRTDVSCSCFLDVFPQVLLGDVKNIFVSRVFFLICGLCCKLLLLELFLTLTSEPWMISTNIRSLHTCQLHCRARFCEHVWVRLEQSRSQAHLRSELRFLSNGVKVSAKITCIFAHVIFVCTKCLDIKHVEIKPVLFLIMSLTNIAELQRSTDGEPTAHHRE